MNDYSYISKDRTTNIHNTNGVEYITYKSLDNIPWLTNAFSTRTGGVSDGIYSTMNLNFNVGDAVDNVKENFKRFADAIDVDYSSLVYSHQTHTVNVMEADSSMSLMGIERERSYENIDGLITNEKGVCLVTSYADCVPIYLVDTTNKAIGLAHSGWRGTVGNIIKSTLKLMQEKYNTSPLDIIACIGPSICKDCYEVSEDVIEEFKKKYSPVEIEQIAEKKPYTEGKYLLNLHKACEINLLNEGVLKENIALPDICTCCNSERLFSHRASKGKRGGLCAFLMINQ